MQLHALQKHVIEWNYIYIGLNESLKFYVFGLGKKSNLETFKDNLHFELSLPLLQ